MQKLNKGWFKKGHKINTGIKRGTSGMKGKKHTDITKKKMSLKQKGRIITWGDKISKAKKGIPNLKQRRENNPRWNKNINYVNLHKWVAYNKGKPKKCEFCGIEDAKKYEWACKDHSYKRDLDLYIRLCTSCHRLHDIKINEYITGNRKIK